eukprot:8377267-Pyramimonas_sp.AAC.1
MSPKRRGTARRRCMSPHGGPPAWAEDGWSILVPSHALRTFAKLHKRVSPSAPVAGIKSTSETAIARWTEA